MASHRLNQLLVLFMGSAAALGCGGPRDTDFGTGDGSAGESAAGGSGGSGPGGSAQGGSSGSSSGSGGDLQGGSATGGSATGGTANGGGSGQGGSSGSSGGGGQGGDDCSASIANAQSALLAAQVCNPGIDAPTCTGSVQDLCDCTVPVNDRNSDATKSYLSLREAAMKCHPVCLAVVCREPTTPMCAIGGATTNIVVAQARCTWSPR